MFKTYSKIILIFMLFILAIAAVSAAENDTSEVQNSDVLQTGDVQLNAGDVSKFYSGSERYVASVTYSNGTPIAGEELVFSINSENYTRTTNENGSASVAINLNSGHYDVSVSNAKYNLVSKNRIDVSPTIYANDITKIFRNGTQYLGLFLDSNGKILNNSKVSYNIHGVFYNRTTSDKGWAKLNLNLEEGTYLLTSINLATGEMRTNNIRIISLIDSTDLVKYDKSSSQFIVRIHSDDGGWAGAGEKVSMNIHGMIYNRTTNATGHIKLNINIEPGTYSITTYYGECRKGNMITVYPVLYANDYRVSYGVTFQFKCTLLDGQGKVFPGQFIRFNIHGVLYDRLTDSDGVAKLNIRLQPGEYIITSQYGESRLSNTITIV